MFHRNPRLAVDLLTELPIPHHDEVTTQSGDLPDCPPTEYRADAVVVLHRDDRPVMAIIVENQLNEDKNKKWSWPVYLATVRARYRCAAELLVICPDLPTTRWAKRPIQFGPSGSVVFPVVIGPDDVPRITDPQQMHANLELAALSVISHGGSEAEGSKILSCWLDVITQTPDDRSPLYFDYVAMQLSEEDRKHMEALMALSGTYEYQSDFAKRFFGQGEAEGRTRGEAEALLTVLTARGLHITDDHRTRITTCTDLNQLQTWLTKAVTITNTTELFD